MHQAFMDDVAWAVENEVWCLAFMKKGPVVFNKASPKCTSSVHEDTV
jgi:hypothetical protein